MVSAHEYGARYGRTGARASELFSDALLMSADFVEFDVRRTADGVFVISHDRTVELAGGRQDVAHLTLDQLHAAGADVFTYAEALGAIRGKARAHLDLKFAPPESSYDGPDNQTWEVQATSQALAALGADNMVVTTGRDLGVAAVRRWAATDHPALLVGLSLGGSKAHLPWRERFAARWSELFPAHRVKISDPNVVVANKWLALFGVARWTHRRGLLLLVWTVDDHRGLRRWLGDPRCWMVTTNRVREAVRIRDGYLD
ncbi:MAG TPA: glycerophosphodiester phosphodiesterase family protein [Nocardioidaceae bacterium]